MSLAAGSRLGPYEIVSPIGAGGMGEVYRARDTRLHREVAIKVLPELLASDPERLARFRREAQTLAALNHPNIAQIHGLEEEGATHALVMELVEGEDLAQRVARGALPLDEALPVARQIAEALDAAHESGIIHRDLKPANVRLRPDGTVKVLDFGLAKALEPASVGSSAPTLANSPTLTQATQFGVILGSAPYMAPEQARGRAVDRRADVWAFGAVLYEMLTGRRAFEGEETSDVLASVLKSEPDYAALPSDTPAAVRRLLRRCLTKDPRQRLSSIRDARLELDERDAPGEGIAPVLAAQPVRRSALARFGPPLAVAALAAGLTAIAMRSRTPGESSSTGAPVLSRLSILAPPGRTLFPDSSGVSISPDGRHVAFLVGNVVGQDTELWVRDLGSPTARRIESGDGAQYIFWSPDSRKIGIGGSDQLRIVAVEGGRAQILTDISGIRGGDWNAADQILYVPAPQGPLYRISANGGEPVAVTTLDAALGESSHRFPEFLPGGDRFLFATLPAHDGKFDVFASSLSEPSKRVKVGAFETAPQWIEPGWLLFGRRGVLAVQRFDPERLELQGDAFPLEDEPTAVWDPAFSVTAMFAATTSQAGSLAYFSSGSGSTRAAWVDETGREVGTLDLPRGQYSNVSVSPDGTQAIFVRSISATESTLWLVDLERDEATPLATGGGRNESPIWSPDGRRIVFSSDREGPQSLYEIGIAEPAAEKVFYRSPILFKDPDAWTRDGRWITLQQLDPVGKQNIWLLPTSEPMTPEVYAQGPTRELNGTVSPDGAWMAFASEETGRMEMYVQSFPKPGRRMQVSREGGLRAWWSPDGREITWVTESKPTLFRARLEPVNGGAARFGEPRRLGALPPGARGGDAMPDRHRFLVLFSENVDPGSIVVVQNWPAALPRTQ